MMYASGLILGFSIMKTYRIAYKLWYNINNSSKLLSASSYAESALDAARKRVKNAMIDEHTVMFVEIISVKQDGF